VVISGNRIAGVGPEGKVAVPKDAEIVDASGKTILPGLWDMHVHTSDDDGLLHLAAGVTSVRDLANDTDELLLRRRRYDEGSLAGPRIVMAGIIDGPGPYAGPTKVLVSDVKEARAAVDRYADLGYVQIKIYSSVKPELVPAIVSEARARGLRVSGHVPAFMTAEEAVKDGFDEIQHANFLFLNFWGDTIKDTRTPLRFTAVAEKAAALDLKSDRVQAFVRLLKEHRTVLDPTLNVFETMFTARKGSLDPAYASVAGRMPAQVRRGFLTGGLSVPDGMDATYRASFVAMLAMINMMHHAGITIVAGTDSLPGFGYERELELYGRAGIPAAEVLRIATLGAARVMKLDGELGSIEAGKLADVILVDGNPTESLGDLRRVSLVVKDGAVYDPEAILKSSGVRPIDPREELKAP
jgi:imidazolonepropionase-like amidohydrolase